MDCTIGSAGMMSQPSGFPQTLALAAPIPIQNLEKGAEHVPIKCSSASPWQTPVGSTRTFGSACHSTHSIQSQPAMTGASSCHTQTFRHIALESLTPGQGAGKKQSGVVKVPRSLLVRQQADRGPLGIHVWDFCSTRGSLLPSAETKQLDEL